ncbi:MAG: hypothetical protein CTY19_05710 [Methylomonas sp.]|nr:MAG: hypothetical protein CTY19_05710 [Methylomonas sp.]
MLTDSKSKKNAKPRAKSYKFSNDKSLYLQIIPIGDALLPVARYIKSYRHAVDVREGLAIDNNRIEG